jgi:hypothetical protein
MESYEHEATDVMTSFLINGQTILPRQFQFQFDGTSYKLSYGQIVALAGDHFKNFDILKAASNELISAVLNSEVYKEAAEFDLAYFVFQNAGHMSYYENALFNPEHFRGAPEIIPGLGYIINPLTDDSVITYRDGHEYSLKTASLIKSPAAQYYAYAINAFYDHFLTDMFSSGHLRVPRRQLHSFDYSARHTAGDMFTSRQMHNEDGNNGLWVTNQLGEIWKAYGDGKCHYFNIDKFKTKLNPSWIKCLNAVKQSVEEITEVISGFKRRNPDNFQALNNRPEVFPPKADIYEGSRIADYKVEMKPLGNSKEIEFYIIGKFQGEPKLLVPKHMVDSFLETHGWWHPLFLLLLSENDSHNIVDNIPTANIPRTISKSLYIIETTFTGKTEKKIMEPDENMPWITSDKPAKQTCPLYIIANNRLFVRVGKSGIPEEESYDKYVTSEFIPSDPMAFDRGYGQLFPPPPPITERLKGRYQGELPK